MKRMLSFVLAFALLISSAPFTAAESSRPTVTVQTVTAQAGDTVAVDVVVSDVVASSYQMTVQYDKALKLVEIQEGEASLGMMNANVETGKVADFALTDKKIDGVIFTLIFEIAADAKAGLYEIALDLQGFTDLLGQVITVDVFSGGIEILPEETEPTAPSEEPIPSEPIVPTDPVPTEPAVAPVLTVQTVEACPGETVTLAVVMSATRYASYELQVVWSEWLTLVDIAEGDEAIGMFEGNVEIGNIIDYTTRDKKVDGEIFLLTFEVSPYAKKGLQEVTLNIKGFYLISGESLAVDLVSGGVYVTEDGVEEPVPTEPVPTEPIPTEPTPTEPTPTEPIPTEPTPTEPTPTEPAPTEPNPVLTVGTVEAKPGETVTIAVTMSATKYASYELQVIWGDWLTLVEIEEGDEAIGMFTGSVETGKIVDYTTKDKKVNGEIFLLTFEVSPYAKKGLQEVTLDMKGFYLISSESIAVDLVSGGVYVTEDGMDEPEPTEPEPTEPEPTEPEPTEPPEPTPVITVDTVNGRPGDTVTVAVSVSNMNCVSYQLTVLYDTAAMTLVEILKGEEALGDFAANTNTGIIRDFANSDKNLNGNLFYLVFEIAEDATAGLTEVALKIKGFYKADQSTIAVDVISGGVNVSQHNYVATVTAPTCTEQGYTTYVCASCGASYVANYVAATGHTYDSGVVIKTPACTMEGEKLYTCHCGHTETGPVAPLGHTPGEGVYENFEKGSGETFCDVVKHCTVCGEECSRVRTPYLTLTVETVQVGPGGTVAVQVSVSAVECASYELMIQYAEELTLKKITKGSQTLGFFTGNKTTGKVIDFTSSDVSIEGDIFVMTFEVQENITEAVYEVTCDVKGFYKADRSELAYDVISGGIYVHEHSYVGVKTEPTCLDEGYTTYTCHCGDSYVDDYVAALGHAWDGGKVTTAPTCTKEGIKTYTCQHCDATRTEAVAATGHSYATEKTAPTCTEQGYTTYTCHCGDTYKADYVNALGHRASAAVEENRHYENGACYVDRVVYCAVCKAELSREKVKLFTLGDVNNDGEITVLDAMLVAQYIVGDIDGSTVVLAAMDVNGDNEIDVLDAMLIAQYIVGDISWFPIENFERGAN